MALLKITHDPSRHTLLVTGLPHHAWMLFQYEGTRVLNPCLAISSNIRYLPDITGAPNPSWRDTETAWDFAREAAQCLSSLPIAQHAPKTRMNASVAFVLAMEYRAVHGPRLLDEDTQLPRQRAQLNTEDRRMYDRRKRGLVVL